MVQTVRNCLSISVTHFVCMQYYNYFMLYALVGLNSHLKKTFEGPRSFVFWGDIYSMECDTTDIDIVSC